MTQSTSEKVPAEDTKRTGNVSRNLSHFWRASIRNRLVVIVAGAAIIPVVLVSIFLGWVTYTQIRNALTQDAFDKLAAVQSIKTDQITSYLTERNGDMVTLRDTVATLRDDAISKLGSVAALKNNELTRIFQGWDEDVRDVASDPGVVAGMRALSTGFQELGSSQARSLYLGRGDLQAAQDGSAYSTAHMEQQGFFSGYTGIHGYEDAFLIDPAGNVVYSVKKGESFGTNLVSGAYKDSNLAGLYSNLKGAKAGQAYIADVGLVDGKPVMFIGAPIYDGATFVGTLAYQLPLTQIDAIMQERTGLGETGETYLVGSDKLFRSASRFVTETTTLNPKYPVDTQGAEEGLAGNSGNAVYPDYRGTSVLSAYAPVNVPGLKWALLAETDVAEAFVPHVAGQAQDFFTQYKENYGYYDIFLIDPDGYAFYTVAQEPDYQTNLLTGVYSTTNLGALVADVEADPQFRFSDFAAYAPSGGKPAAFFGIPVLGADNKTEMIVAAQVSLDQINAIMGQATGLGKSGETYLVGQDQLWRNDSRFLADLGVDTTVLNDKFKVDTVASRAALAGESGQQAITDYRGVPVLSAWSPITVGKPDATHPQGQSWGLLAEIDQTEALAPVGQLIGTLTLVIGLAVVVIGTLAVFFGARFALGFTRPIISLTGTATQVAAGNLNLASDVKSKDEIGTLSKAFNSMTSQLRELISGLEGRVAARTKDLASVAEVGTATATILETDKLLQSVVDLSKERFELYHSHIYLLDESGENLVLAAGAGEAGRQMVAEKRTIPLDREQSLVARAARERKGVIVNDVTQSPDFLPNPLLPDTRSELAVPMIASGKVIGVFDVQSEKVGRFTDSDISIQTTLAAQVATSIQNVRSFEQSKAEADLESLVNAIGQKIQRATTVDETLQTAIREIGLALGASRVSVNVQANRQRDDAAARRN